jgi:CHAD domain-containing protein
LQPAAFLSEAGEERISRFRERLREAASNPASVDAVHDLRVAIRRVLAWIAAWERLVGPHPGLREARASLKKLMTPLGRLRDAHVKRDAVRTNVPIGDRQSYLYALLVASDVARWERAVRTLLGERWPARIRLRVPKKGPAPEGGAEIAAEAAGLLEQLEQDVSKHREEALDPARPDALHRLRLAFKKYRYSWELFAPLLAQPVKSTAKRYHAFQTVLGTIHDCDVILREASSFREYAGVTGGESTLEAAFRRLREEKLGDLRRMAGTPARLARIFGRGSRP